MTSAHRLEAAAPVADREQFVAAGGLGVGMQAERRLDIDGLRAIAVLSVIFFHAYPALLPGGFVGVDVFFVISGYLISGILLRSLGEGRLSFLDFYSHRIRRIFPALLLVLASCLLFGNFALFPDELAELAAHVVAGSAFVSNFLLAGEVGYFDGRADLKVLLHLWSLAIEEQFYLLWPLLLWLLARGRRTGAAMLALFAASFLYSLWLTGADPSQAFYSPLVRFWELIAGALLAWAQLRGNAFAVAGVTARMAGPAGFLGLGMILAAVLWIDTGMPFPGMLAALPVLGTVLVIASGPHGSFHRVVLSGRAMVWIGSISYPLYLWHWPLLSFARRLYGTDLAAATAAALLAASFLLAWLTYVLVEQPLRRDFPVKKVAAAALGLMMLVGGAGLAIYHGEGFEGRTIHLRGDGAAFMAQNRKQLKWFDPSPACIAEYGLAQEAKAAGPALFCSKSPGAGAPSVVIFGDSTANHLFPGMADLYAAKGLTVLNLGNGTCAPFRGLKGHHPWNTVCETVNRKIYDAVLADPHIKIVIFGFAPWDIKNVGIPGLRAADSSVAERFEAMRPLVERDVRALAAAGKTVIATFDTPNLGEDPQRCFDHPAHCIGNRRKIDQFSQPYVAQWQQLFARLPEVCVFEQLPVFVLPDGNYRITRDSVTLFRDDHHLSYFGSAQVARHFSTSRCFGIATP